jgi:hypothetical protein
MRAIAIDALAAAVLGSLLMTQALSGLGPDGKEFQTPAGVRNNAKSIFKIAMIAQGFKGRPK